MAKTTFICPICQKEFQRYTSQSHTYCSDPCRQIASRKPKQSFCCPCCRKEFTPQNHEQVTCSRHCHKLYFYRTLREKAGGDKQYHEQRFWLNIEKTGPDDCWEWQGRIDKDGYGRFNCNHRAVLAHRFAYMLKHGSIPSTVLVCHKCDNRLCCNDNHFFIGTSADNTADMKSKNRQAWGERSSQAKLTTEQVLEIKELHATGKYTNKVLAITYNVIPNHISRIIRGVAWKHLTPHTD